MKDNLSLYDLHLHIRQVIALNFQTPVWIVAEIAESTLSRGHLYLNLVQKTDAPGQELGSVLAQANAVVWQNDRRRLVMEHGQLADIVLSIGVQARLYVRVDFHEQYGLKLKIENIDPAYSVGIMALQRRNTIATLVEEGLLARNRNLHLAMVVQRIAVITSPDAAGFHDFRAHLAQNTYGYAFHYQCFFAAVQGRNAESEIGAALTQIASKASAFDAAVIIRGGGAKLDLAAFDGLELGRTVAAMPLPILSGIGHETDESVLDMVAYQAFKTPTAVADFLIERALSFESQVWSSALEIGRLGQQYVQSGYDHLARTLQSIHFSAQQQINAAQHDLSAADTNIPTLAQQVIKGEQRHIYQLAQLITVLDPETTLKRGFSITYKDHKVVSSADTLQSGDRITTRFSDGDVESTVNES